MISVISAANATLADIKGKVISERRRGGLHSYHDILIIASMGSYRDDIDELITWLGGQSYTACFYGSIENSRAYADARKTKRYGGRALRLEFDVLLLEPFYVYSLPINSVSAKKFMFIPGNKHSQSRIRILNGISLEDATLPNIIDYNSSVSQRLLRTAEDIDYVVSDCVPSTCYGLFTHLFKTNDFARFLSEIQEHVPSKYWISSGYAYDYRIKPGFVNIWRSSYEIQEPSLED